MLLGILIFFVFVGVLFLFLAGGDEPVIEKTKQKTGYYDHNNKYYDSFDDYLRERNAEIDREREKSRREREYRERERERARYESGYERWQREYESSRYESEYEKWKRERYKREDKYDINNKVDKLFNLIVKDFSNNPYYDKIESLSSSHSTISFIYKFENGFKFTLNDKEIRVYNRGNENISSYRLSESYHLKFLKLILEIKQKSQHRSNEKTKREYKRDQPKTEPKVKTTGNPRLDKINEKILLREEQLRKMKSNDPERQALVNELATYKNVADKMKSKIK